MSVRFVIGRAGCGKTHHCLEAIRRRLIDSPLTGPRLILLVPEQASLQMERALLAGDIQAAARAEVLSFRRLAYRILQSTGRPERQAVSPQGRAMVLRAIVGRLAPRLRYYRRVERLGGFFQRLGHTIGELIEEAVSPDDLRPALAGGSPAEAPAGERRGSSTVPQTADGNPQRAAKLADLADIYAAYLDYLDPDRLDASQALQLAREALPYCDLPVNALVWVDGFAGFTRQELLLLAELAGRAATVEITLLVDPGEVYRIRSAADIDAAGLFARTLRTYLRLTKLLAERGVRVDPPLVLSPATPPRFRNAAELARVERTLAIPTGRGGEPADPENRDDPPANVHLVEAPDRRVEVDFAVSQLCHLVHQSNGDVRYRDVAIIVRDLEPYHDLLSAALTERRIPFFIDRRRPTTHHPLVEFLRAALAIAADGFTLESVRLLLKTGLLNTSNEAADEMENYLLAFGLAGRAAWTSTDDWAFKKRTRLAEEASARQQEHLARVNAARRQVLAAVGGFAELAGPAAGGADWAQALNRLMHDNDVGQHLEQWAAAAESDGDVELAEEHRQVWRDVQQFLADLSEGLSGIMLTVTELAAVVEAGLSQLTLGLVPPTLDQVLVGSIERSRHPELKAAIVLGFNDGVFPALGAEDSILNDEDRQWLEAQRLDVGLTRRQRVLDEAMLVYIAATRPSQKLLITLAAGDSGGKALRPSPYVPLLQRALPGLRIRPLGDPFGARRTWPITTARDLAGMLAAELRHRPPLAQDDVAKRQKWNDLYLVARSRTELTNVLRPALAALTFRNSAALSGESVDRLIHGPFRASVSELEAQAACPFKHFAEYALRLREREEAPLQPTDLGTVHHAILEAFLNDLLDRRENLAELADADVLPLLERCAQRVGADLALAGEPASARDAYLLTRSARDLTGVVRAQRRVAAGGRFRPRATERKFGFAGDPQSLPPLDLSTPKGRQVLLRGIIDRVDLAELADELLGVVVDYKRTRDKRLHLTDVYHGLSLQLLGYLLVLADRGETLAGRPIKPAGAFYVSLLRQYRPVDHPDEASGGEDGDPPEIGAAPRGLLDAAHADVLDAEFGESRRSRIFKVFRRQDGGLGYIDQSDAAESPDFDRLLKHTRDKMGQLADGVLDGDVRVAPYRLRQSSPCSFCRMAAVCRFEFGESELRFLEPLKRSAVIEALREKTA